MISPISSTGLITPVSLFAHITETNAVFGDMEIIDNTGKVIKKVDLVVKDDIDKHSFLSLFVKIYKNIINGYL